MPSKKLLGTWIILDICLLAAGIVSLLFSFVWRAPNLLMNMVVSQSDLTAGMVLGIFLCVTFVFSLGGILQPNNGVFGLILLNWMLIADSLVILVVGTFVWFYTLQERNNFHVVFSALSVDTRIQVQDALKCCGYFNSTDFAEVGGAFCSSQDFIQNANNATGNFCVGPITAFADYTLNNIFSSVYGFMAIVIALFLASLCVIKRRQENARFKRIDAKRGGRGFV